MSEDGFTMVTKKKKLKRKFDETTKAQQSSDDKNKLKVSDESKPEIVAKKIQKRAVKVESITEKVTSKKYAF